MNEQRINTSLSMLSRIFSTSRSDKESSHVNVSLMIKGNIISTVQDVKLVDGILLSKTSGARVYHRKTKTVGFSKGIGCYYIILGYSKSDYHTLKKLFPSMVVFKVNC